MEAEAGGRDEPPGAGQPTGGLNDSPAGSQRIGSTRSLAAAYIRLCHDPLADLPRWIDEGSRKPQTRNHVSATIGGYYEHRADIGRFHYQPLPALRGGMDANQQQGRDDNGLPARQGTRVEGHDRLQPLSGHDASRDFVAASDENEAVSSQAEVSAMRAFFGARIEAVGRTLPKHERAAAIMALRNEKKAAIRELTERKRQTRFARRKADQLKRPPRDPAPDG